MKNKLLSMMAIVMAIALVFIAGPVLAATTQTTTTDGTTPWVYDWTATTNGTGQFANVDATHYDAANGLEIADLMVVSALDSNSYFKISVKHGGWTLPASYVSDNGKAVTGGADNDFRIRLNNKVLGTGAAQDFAIETAFDNVYKAVTSVDQVVAQGKSETEAYEGVGFDVDGSVLFDYDYDIKGAYALTLTFTIANATE